MEKHNLRFYNLYKKKLEDVFTEMINTLYQLDVI